MSHNFYEDYEKLARPEDRLAMSNYFDINKYVCYDYKVKDKDIIDIQLNTFDEKQVEFLINNINEKSYVRFGKDIYKVIEMGTLKGSCGYIGSLILIYQKRGESE